ncbi:restriction endonuclease subunit S [Clostridium bornimense]|uniref:restriction endonuclease subunit S n=1 Tax=Clostridium bornimense TaxID=1216932 RepID=UPI001C0F4F32|nr:restriction endonuclease subunit S [Clostridium bornimense]MBU5316271.1 restriction endonuclease subunit S [Clostridium bornimense]
MRVDELKNKILQLAIQGKLVPQDPNDEPASVLLERIKKEKEQLIKEKKIKKEKPLPEISEEEKAFEIPEGWEWVRAEYITSKIGDGLHGTPKYCNDGEYYFINGNNLVDDKIKIKEDTKKVSYDEYFKYRKDLNENTILISINGTIGNTAFYNKEKVVLGKSAAYLNVFNKITKGYIAKVFKTNFIIKQINTELTGTTIKNLSLKALRSLIIPLPPLQEQKRIVAKVDELFSIIDKLGENKEALSKNIDITRDKVLQLAIQGKLVPQDPDDEPASVLLEKIKKEKEQLIKEKKIKKEKLLPEISEEEKAFEIPEGWEWCRLGEIGSYKKGPFGSTITKSMFVPKSENTIKVYEQKNAINKNWKLGDYYVTKEYFESKLKGFEVFEGDIIVSCAGTIGETYIMPKGIERGVINQALMKMNIFDGINIDYFLIYFESILKITAKESSKGSAIKNIPPFDIFKKMLFALPPLQEQKRIVAKIDEIMEYLDKLQDLIDGKSSGIEGVQAKEIALSKAEELV